MKKYISLLILLLLLTSCRKDEYIIISSGPVDGYYIYQKDSSGFLCNSYHEDIYYSGETYNYGYSFRGCGADMSFFIMNGEEYMYLGEAIDKGIITLESLIPELQELERVPEDISSDEADYYWMDFHINSKVIYVYAGGECDQNGTETFIINGQTYYYEANGCLKNNIIFMRIDGENIPIVTLIQDGIVDGELLIPFLSE